VTLNDPHQFVNVHCMTAGRSWNIPKFHGTRSTPFNTIWPFLDHSRALYSVWPQ